MNSTITKCWYNDCELTADDIDAAYDIDGEPVCYDCYDSWRCENESECPFCCNYLLDDDLSECFILTDEDFGEVGLYRPLSYPFYSQPVIGTPTLWTHAVQRIGSLLPSAGMDAGGHPAAFVCKSCMGEEGKAA